MNCLTNWGSVMPRMRRLSLPILTTISGTEGLMRKGSMKVLPGEVRVVFHEPIYADKFPDREELMMAVRASIASGLPERMRG